MSEFTCRHGSPTDAICPECAEDERAANEARALKAENADLRARLEAIQSAWNGTAGFVEAEVESLLDRALDLTKPFTNG